MKTRRSIFLDVTYKVKCWLLSTELIKNYVYKPLSYVNLSLYVCTDVSYNVE